MGVLAIFVGFLFSKVVRMGPDTPQDSFGLWTRLEPPGQGRGRPLGVGYIDLSQRLRYGPGMFLDQVSGQTVDSRPIEVFGRDRNFGQPGLDLGFLLLRQDRCLSSSHLSCLNSRHLSCLNRRHLSCLNRRHHSSRPGAGSCRVFC